MSGPRRHSFIFPILLILVGLYFLAFNMGWIQMNPWDALQTFWPLFLVAIGLDIIMAKSSPVISILVALIFFAFLFIFAGVGHIAKGIIVEPPSKHFKIRNVAIETGNAEKAQVHLSVDAGEMTIKAGPEGGTLLLQGQIETPPGANLNVEDRRKDHQASIDVRVEKHGDHSVTLFSRHSSSHPAEWDLELSRSIPLSLNLELNAGTGDLDLSELKVDDLNLTVQAGKASLTLPVVDGEVKAAVEGNAGKVTLEIPHSCAARITVNSGISSVNIDERFPEHEGFYISPDYETAPCRWNVALDAKVSSVTVR